MRNETPLRAEIAAALATLLILALPRMARAQAEWTLGPFTVTTNDPVRVILGRVGKVAGASRPGASAARVIPTAERYLGTPYRYGGTSPVTGFDCSGFVQYVFARNAVKLPRTSRQQAKVGVAMPRRFKSLSAGDLVMFAEPGEPISHVAIYAGHNRIIHATSSGGKVRYDDLGTRRGQWFVDHMVAARRVTPDGRGLMLDLVKMLDARSLVDTALDVGDFAPRPRGRH
jgi:cell wall-associated NlpC family hydrolase